MRYLWLFTVIFLTACSITAPEPDTSLDAPASDELKIEPMLHDSEAPEIVENTGSLLPIERLLTNGVLDLGDRDAPLTLLVFTEHHCRYCREFHNELLPRLKEDYIDTGKLRVQISAFTLKKYSNSIDAAKGALCAAQQNKGMLMQSKLFEQGNKNNTAIISYAEGLGMNKDIFINCQDNPETAQTIKLQQEWAKTLGVENVPTFFLNGEKFIGLPYYAELRGRIYKALN